MNEREQAFRARVAKVLDKADIVAVVGGAVKLGLGRTPRGKCPFHGSNSDSLTVYPEPRKSGTPYAHCWGCGWHGDAIKFVADFHGLPFMDALVRLEGDHGLDGLAAQPVRRERAPQVRSTRERELVDAATLGRFIWDTATADGDAVRTYLRGRGVPAGVLTDDRLRDFRLCRVAPIVPWEVGRRPTSVPTAPAIVGLIRRPVDPDGGPSWRPIGMHVTFLTPDCTAKMARMRADGSPYPARKMLGAARGGCIVLGRYQAHVPLFVGEGNETVLSGMALAEAPEDACGLAALSLDNLQGRPLRARKGALPLYDLRPDPANPALAFAHDGPVTGLIDADMKPLRGVRDPATGGWRGEDVIEARGARPIARTISTAERAAICAELFVKSWRAAGSRRVTAARPPMGMDFNDLGRAVA
jgi:DNA primase